MGIALHEKAMLANLTVHQWGAGKTDKEVTAETHSRYRASADAGNYRKRLMYRQLAPLRSAGRELEEFHKEQTLPWHDRGARILLSKNYMKYMKALKTKIDVFNEALNLLILTWPENLRQAQKDLGEMFNPDEYPKITELREKFWIESTVEPLPNMEDWRVGLAEEEIADILYIVIINWPTFREAVMKYKVNWIFWGTFLLVTSTLVCAIFPTAAVSEEPSVTKKKTKYFFRRPLLLRTSWKTPWRGIPRECKTL